MSGEHEMRVQAECGACKGTGLYVGMAERTGAAVQCGTCKGTGERELVFSWNDFTGRKRRVGVTHVVEVNPGIAIGAGNGYRLSDFGGISYDAWWNGDGFPDGSEMRAFTCPAWWYQAADYKRKPNWEECDDSLGGRFSDCPHFVAKAKCWERFDTEATR